MTKNDKESNNKNATEEAQQQKRCFVMMPFSDPDGYAPGHFRKIYEQILEPAITEAGFKPERVDENSISDSIIIN